MKNLIYASCIIVLISLVPITSFGLANTAWIPPTNAFDKIHSDNGTVNAVNYSMPLNIHGGTNISVKSNNSTHTITITNTMLPGTGTGTYNTTQANNVNINTGGAKINFINGTNNPIRVVNSPSHNQVNITISSSSGSSTQGTYNQTYANNALINSGGFKINFINGSGATVNVKTSDTNQKVNVTISATGTAGVTQANTFTGKINFTGNTGNVTVTNSSGTINFNTGNDIPHLSKANNFTETQLIVTNTIGEGWQSRLSSNTPTASSQYVISRSDGTVASKTATVSGDWLGLLGFGGYQSTTNAFTPPRAYIVGVAAENYTSVHQGSYLRFETTNSSTNANREVFRLNDYGGMRIKSITDPSAAPL